MDPTVTLDALRDAINRAVRLTERAMFDGDDVQAEMINEIRTARDRFEALDDWLTRGNVLPYDWRIR